MKDEIVMHIDGAKGWRGLSREEFSGMEFPQYSVISYSRDMDCPECGKSSHFDDRKVSAKPVGWCDTPSGLMLVAECPCCHSKYRFHISTLGRWDKDVFYRDFALTLRRYEMNDG